MPLNIDLKHKIDLINKKSLLGRGIFIEIGAGGNTVASHFYNSEKASNTVYFSICPYSKESQEYYFGDSGHRSVSENQCYYILNQTKANHPDIDFIFVSTFQMATEKSINTHGWIGIMTKKSTKYYHITIDEFMERSELIDKISSIGLQLLIEQDINNNVFTNIDIVLDENLNDDLETVIKLNQHNTNCRIYLKSEQESEQMYLSRFEEFTRSKDIILIYKGSFNPVHNEHIVLVEEAKKKYGVEKENILFSISINTYDKGEVDIQDIINRCMVINKLGYGVIIFRSGFYLKNLINVRERYKKKLVFLLGADTMQRVLEPYVDEPDSFNRDFENAEFFIYNRKGFDIKIKLYGIKNIEISNKEEGTESSTKIRKMISEKKDISSKVPAVCLETIKKIYYDK
jgi:nicotinic acid mononucleotide adenylyltransferase